MLVHGVHLDGEHRFSKGAVPSIELRAGWGVVGDAHAGVTVQHRSRVARDPSQPNLRQVHLIALELLTELQAKGYEVGPGQLGENVTTSGIDLLGLPTGALLRVGDSAVVEVTGLRNPCLQIEAFRTGLLAEVVGRSGEGAVERRAGVMGVVRASGVVAPGDRIVVELPDPPYVALERV